ncbi:MAG: prolyl oligopeptidase family serine peptidase [Flavobacteriaceae bacterium]
MRILPFILMLVLLSCATNSQVHHYVYPKTEAIPTEEVLGALRVSDEYRHLQNTSDQGIQNWYTRQTSYADSILTTLEGVSSINRLLDDNEDNENEYTQDLRFDSRGGLYYLKRVKPEPVSSLYFKEDVDKEAELLYSPKDYKPESGLEYWIDYIKPSWDGNYIGISLRHSNTFSSEVVILDTRTGKLTNDFISNLRDSGFGGLSWTPDSKGFTYIHFPVDQPGEEGFLQNSENRYHPLNSGKSLGTYVFGTKNNPKIKPEEIPVVLISSDTDEQAIAYIMDNSHYYTTYYTEIEDLQRGGPVWKPLYGPTDEVWGNEGLYFKDRLYYLTAKDAPNFQINAVHIDTLDFSRPSIEVAHRESEVLSDFAFIENGMYYTTKVNGVKAMLYYRDSSSTKEVQLPFASGDIVFIEPNGRGESVIIELLGWSNDKTRFLVKKDKVVGEIELNRSSELLTFKTHTSEEIVVKGHDGAEIPVSIIYDKTKGYSNKPVLIESYGAYGHNLDPRFTQSLSTWIALGGVRVVAHIRGGGEKGKPWHDAGKKATKSNSWKDIISVTEYLIEMGYTTKEKTVLYTASAGAVAQGMAAIERPDLFAVFLAKVPLLNPMKLKEGSSKQLSYTEFGDIDDPEEAKYLQELDPYNNLTKDIQFPPTLFYAAGKDDRLDLWETGKFIAKLQNSHSTRGPYLLKVMPEWGHGSYSNRSYAELFAFALNNIAKDSSNN